MQFIIHKLRRFKINLFDILVLIAIVLLIAVFLWLRLSKQTEWINLRIVASNDEWWWEGQPPQWWYVDDLSVGLTSKNSFGEVVGEIINIESFDIGGYKRRAFIDIRLKGAYDKNRQMYLYNFQSLQVGKPLDLTFGRHNIRGLVIYIDKDRPQYQDRSIEVKLFKIRTWEAESLTKGLEMKDSLGRVLATVKNVQAETAREYEYSDIRGRMIQVANPDFRDVTIELTIKTFTSGTTEHFVDRAVIKVGERIWFQFPQVAISDAEITKILE